MSNERRSNRRLEKKYQVFCKTGNTNCIAESYDVSEKGLGIYTDIEAQIGDAIEVRIVPPDEVFSFTYEGVIRHVALIKTGEGQKYRIGIEFTEGLADFASEKLVKEHEAISASSSLIINASPQECYDAICNFESYPSWQKTVQSVNVLKRYPDQRPENVEFLFEAFIVKVRIVNRYSYFDKDYILSWKAVDGDVKVNEGGYVFKQLREGRTNATFSVHMELGFYAPKRILNYMTNVTMRNSMRSLKNVVESGMLKNK